MGTNIIACLHFIIHARDREVKIIWKFRPNSAAAKAAQITEKAKEAARNAIEEDCKRIGTITFWEIVRSKFI